MILKNIKIAVILLCFLLPLLCFGIFLQTKQVHLFSRGDYFFDKTRNHANISQIALLFPDNKAIHIQKKNDFWTIKEGDNYYASITKINALVGIIRNTIIYRSDLFKDTDKSLFNNAIRLISYDSKGNIVDEASIAPLEKNNKYYSALRNNDGFLYQLNTKLLLSQNAMDWVQMPLITWDFKQIKRIKTNNFEVFRRFEYEDFQDINSPNVFSSIKGLTDNFWYLTAEEIKNISQFDTSKFPKIKNYEITLFNGIIYNIDIFSDGTQFWISIQLKKDAFIKKPSLQFIKENSMLYDGWFFKINPDKGHIITEFVP